MTIASLGVLIACLLLTGAAVLFSLNISQAMDSIESGNRITVYMQRDLPAADAETAGVQLRQLGNIEACEFVEKDEALKQMMDRMGDDGTLYSDRDGVPVPGTLIEWMNNIQ